MMEDGHKAYVPPLHYPTLHFNTQTVPVPTYGIAESGSRVDGRKNLEIGIFLVTALGFFKGILELIPRHLSLKRLGKIDAAIVSHQEGPIENI